MTVELAIVISVVSLLFTAIKTFSDMKRNTVKDTEVAAGTQTSTLVELRMLNKGIDDVKKEIKDFRTEIKELGNKVIEVDISAKQAHKRIDEIVKRFEKCITCNAHEAKEG